MLETALDPELTSEQRSLVKALSAGEVDTIDEALLAASSHNWRKVAFVVANAMSSLGDSFPGIPDVYFSERVRALVSFGRLNSQGNLLRMRFSEVQFPVS